MTPYIKPMTGLDRATAPFNPRLIPGAIALISLGALAIAFTAEFGFGLEPCILCRYQQTAYAVAAAVGLLALAPPLSPFARTLLVALCGAVFVAGAGIAFYHVGVEQHWWGGLSACGGGIPGEISLADLKAQLTTKQPKPCDQVDWTLFGLSLATYNVGMYLLMAAFSLIGARRLLRAAGR